MSDVLIRNAAAIMTGERGPSARAIGPDIRVRGAKINAIGALTPEPGEAVIDASNAPPPVSVFAQGRAAGAERHAHTVACSHALPLSRGVQ
jgi:hypothetical protein